MPLVCACTRPQWTLRERFVATAGDDPALRADMLTQEQLGRRVIVSERDGRNFFSTM